jgi:tetratricopeptide (TPR) repeat protein
MHPKGADTMKKPSIADKKVQKALNDPQFQKNWASHMKSFGPILKDAFAEDPQGRVNLCAALTNITAKKQPQALLKLNSLQKSLVTDADKAAFFFAMGLFCEYAGKFDEMAALYNQANDLHHTFYLPYLKAGKYALDTRDYAVAEKNYRSALRCFPAIPGDKDKQLMASAHTNLASCLLMMHRPAEAETALDTARKLMPLFPGRAAPEAILHAIRGENGAMLSALESLKAMAPFAYDAIKKSTDRILAGTEPQFFTVPVTESNIAAFWNWFTGVEADLKAKADKQEYDAVMTAVGEHLLEAFPFLEQRPTTALGKNDKGYVIQLKDMYATGIIDAYGKLLSACPEDLKSRWLFHVVH